MLHKNIESNDTGNVSNVTIISIMYLLQQAGELLQDIQVRKSLWYNIFIIQLLTFTVQQPQQLLPRLLWSSGDH